jgi:hypothetical protein
MARQLEIIFGLDELLNTWYSILVTIYIIAK